jgi:hypothetical protein
MNELPEQSEGPVWERGWDDHERRQRDRLAKLSLAQKLAWLEEAHRLVRQIASNSKNPRSPK